MRLVVEVRGDTRLEGVGDENAGDNRVRWREMMTSEGNS